MLWKQKNVFFNAIATLEQPDIIIRLIEQRIFYEIFFVYSGLVVQKSHHVGLFIHDIKKITIYHILLKSMAKSTNPRTRGGIDFLTLSRGYEKNYTTGFLVNLDMDLLSLIG